LNEKWLLYSGRQTMITRTIKKDIEKRLFRGKAILLIGPRQTGKTTLAKLIFDESGNQKIWFDGDEPDIRENLSDITSTELKNLIGKKKLVVIDEAQRIKNIGLTIKIIVDNLKDVQVIATGSSALDLAQEIKEPLTGRKFEYFLFPLTFSEMSNHLGKLEEKRLISARMLYGYYPEIINNAGEEKLFLNLLTDSYLFKDILIYGNIKKSFLLENLLKALALQVGSEVSYSELGRLVGAKNQTIEKYIELLEKSFVIFRLSAFSRNVRNEIKKGKKIYFYDNGIRNAILNNFNQLNLRNDLGALWENFLISERRKMNFYAFKSTSSYFWRTKQQQEIDYLEESDGKIDAYEFKWNPKIKKNFPKTFLNAYPNSNTFTINSKNFSELFLS
jgi:predicted AAA+ superfamily ATPase